MRGNKNYFITLDSNSLSLSLSRWLDFLDKNPTNNQTTSAFNTQIPNPNPPVLATVLPTIIILLIVSICLVIYLCRRWRRRSALSKGFRNIGSFGPNLISGTLDRKAMLESSSESSDTHQRSHHAHHHHSHLRAPTTAIYDVHGALAVSV